jgi:dihydroorotate dehydrogenase (fumarate)
MANLSVKYMGLDLQSPLILGSCGLSNKIDNILAAQEAGCGAVVLKSIFEEEIKQEAAAIYKEANESMHTDAYDYIAQYQEMAAFEKSLLQIRKAKDSVSIPVIASINCYSGKGWTKYAKAIEEAGADALEINYFSLPVYFDKTSQEYTEEYFKLIDELRNTIAIPIAIKTSFYFTDMAHIMQQLSYTGLASIVLFNKPYLPDIDIDNLTFKQSAWLSSPTDMARTLRWIGILSENIRCDLCATTGCHDSESLIKFLLAGADAVQAASIFYQKGIDYGKNLLDGLSQWMDSHGFATVNDFKAQMNFTKIDNPSIYFRTQFMQYLIENE